MLNIRSRKNRFLTAQKNNPLLSAGCLDSIWRRAAIIGIISLAGCFSGPSHPPTEIPLEGSNANLSFERVESDPLLYRISIPSITAPLYGTALEECGVKDFVPSKATTRQLLVGFSNLKVLSQSSHTISGLPTLRSEISATVDEEPIKLLTYTIRVKGCVRDFAFWLREADATPDAVTQLQTAVEANFSTLVTK